MIQGILVQAAPAGGGFDPSSLVLLGGIVRDFYFFMIRPQQKKQKEQKNFINEIKKGDHIVTIGGVHGKIMDMDEETVTIDVEKGARIKFERSAISLEASKKQADKKG